MFKLYLTVLLVTTNNIRILSIIYMLMFYLDDALIRQLETQ